MVGACEGKALPFHLLPAVYSSAWLQYLGMGGHGSAEDIYILDVWQLRLANSVPRWQHEQHETFQLYPACMAACATAAGPTRCDNPPNSLPGYTWDNCKTGTAAVQSTCTGGCSANFASSAAISARCNNKGVYEVTGQCTAPNGSRECLALILLLAVHCSLCVSWLCTQWHHTGMLVLCSMIIRAMVNELINTRAVVQLRSCSCLSQIKLARPYYLQHPSR
jgi:hypothetical protein